MTHDTVTFVSGQYADVIVCPFCGGDEFDDWLCASCGAQMKAGADAQDFDAIGALASLSERLVAANEARQQEIPDSGAELACRPPSHPSQQRMTGGCPGRDQRASARTQRCTPASCDDRGRPSSQTTAVHARGERKNVRDTQRLCLRTRSRRRCA
jgi:hypothetical protein